MPKPLKSGKKPKAQTDDEAQGFAEHWPPPNPIPQPVVYQYSESNSSVQIEHMVRGEAKVTVKVYQGTTSDQMSDLCKIAAAAYRKARKLALAISSTAE